MLEHVASFLSCWHLSRDVVTKPLENKQFRVCRVSSMAGETVKFTTGVFKSHLHMCDKVPLSSMR